VAAAIRVLIVDDEPPARRNLAILLQRNPQIARIDECGSGREALAAIRAAPPDLLFLDVQMPECDGFDVIEMLGGALPPAVVFVTAHDEYALRAFDVGALDYLLKPFDDARFERALQRAKARLASADPLVAAPPQRLVVRSTGELRFIDVRDIDWIEAADYYAALHVGGRTHLLRRALADLESDLLAAGFCRVHRSAIVNLQRVQGLELRADGEYDLVLRSGDRLRLRRRYRAGLLERLGVAGKGAGG